MALCIQLAEMVTDSRGGCVDRRLLQGYGEVSQLLSIRTYLVHRRCIEKYSYCAAAIHLETWNIMVRSELEASEKALDALFLKNAVRSHLHFSQLSSWMKSNGGQLPDGMTCTYSISANANEDWLDESKNLQMHTFPVGRIDAVSFAYVTVKWKKYDALPCITPCSEADGCINDGLLSSTAQPYSQNTTNSLSVSLSGSPYFFVPINDCRRSEDDNMNADDSAISSTSLSKNSSYFKEDAFPIDDPNYVNSTPSYIHSDPQIYQFFDIFSRKSNDSKATNGYVLAANDEQIVGLPVVESITDFLSSLSSIEPLGVASPSTTSRREALPRRSLIASAFRFMSTASKAFSKSTGLPLNSSPAPFDRHEVGCSQKEPYAMSGFAKARLENRTDLLRSDSVADEDSGASDNESICTKSTSSSSGLLCNFEESALNGRLEPLASLEGFRLQIASGAFTAAHLTLPVTTFVFNVMHDGAPLPYLGQCSLERLRKGYRIPKKGTIQAVLFNPQGTVVRMFIVRFDVSDMPASSHTFLRQRTYLMPVGCSLENVQRSWLKYLIHFRLATDKRGRLCVHTDIRMLFAQKSDMEALNIELGNDSQHYQLQSFTEMPQKPKFSLRK